MRWWATPGANLIYESAGMLASLLGFSMEGLIIDNDVIGAVQRTIKGIEVTDESLSLETIRKVCLRGAGTLPGIRSDAAFDAA